MRWTHNHLALTITTRGRHEGSEEILQSMEHREQLTNAQREQHSLRPWRWTWCKDLELRPARRKRGGPYILERQGCLDEAHSQQALPETGKGAVLREVNGQTRWTPKEPMKNRSQKRVLSSFPTPAIWRHNCIERQDDRIFTHTFHSEPNTARALRLRNSRRVPWVTQSFVVRQKGIILKKLLVFRGNL